jgi:hypothetical protein
MHAYDVSPGVTVTVVGTSVSTSVDSHGSFTLTGVPAIDVVLSFAGPGINASLPLGTVGANDRVEISVTVNGTTVTLDTQQQTGSDNAVDADGWIESIDTAALRFVLSGIVVNVPSSATIRRQSAPIGLTGLVRGDRAHVHGIKQSDGSITATTVDVSATTASPTPTPTPTPAPTPTPSPTPSPSPTPTPTPSVTLSGSVSGLAGTCPNLTFALDTTNASTNVSTQYGGGGACGDIKNGDKRYLAGTKQTNGRVLATYVSGIMPTPTK